MHVQACIQGVCSAVIGCLHSLDIVLKDVVHLLCSLRIWLHCLAKCSSGSIAISGRSRALPPLCGVQRV